MASRVTKRRIMKHQRRSLTLETKLDILNRIDSGQRQVDVSRAVGLAGSTIRTILRNRDKILKYTKAVNNLGSVKISRTRPPTMVEMERLLNVYIEDNMMQGVLLNWGDIQRKAMSLYEELRKILPDGNAAETFIASKGWLEKFRKRYCLFNIPTQEEGEMNDVSVASEETQEYMSTASEVPSDLSASQTPQDYSAIYGADGSEESQEFRAVLLPEDQSGSNSPRLLESYSRATYRETDSENPGDVVELVQEGNSNNCNENKTNDEIIAADSELRTGGKSSNISESKCDLNRAHLTTNESQWTSPKQETVAQVLKEYLEYKTTRNQERQKNHIHSFFLAMADTVSKFPPHLQVKVKAQVFQAVNEGEMEMVNSVLSTDVSNSVNQASNTSESQATSQKK